MPQNPTELKLRANKVPVAQMHLCIGKLRNTGAGNRIQRLARCFGDKVERDFFLHDLDLKMAASVRGGHLFVQAFTALLFLAASAACAAANLATGTRKGEQET